MSGLAPGKTRGSGSLLKRLRAAEQLGSVNIIKAPQKRWMTAVIEQIFAANMATGSFPAWRHLAYPRGTPEKLCEKVGSWRLCYLRSLSRNLFMEHFGLLSFLRPAKTRGAVDWRDPAPVKVGIVYPHHLHLVSYILSVISLLTHQHQQYHQVCCHFHDICPMGEGPPHLEPTVIKAGDFHHPSRWFSVRWWLSHPIGKNMSWVWKCCPHCYQGSDWKNVWNHLASVSRVAPMLTNAPLTPASAKAQCSKDGWGQHKTSQLRGNKEPQQTTPHEIQWGKLKSASQVSKHFN